MEQHNRGVVGLENAAVWSLNGEAPPVERIVGVDGEYCAIRFNDIADGQMLARCLHPRYAFGSEVVLRMTSAGDDAS